jgi:glutamyl-tRNA reductase
VNSRQEAERIIDEQLAGFDAWLSARRQAPLIQALCAKADQIVELQVDLTLRHLGELNLQQRSSVEAMGRAIASQLLHDAIGRIKDPPEDMELGEYMKLIQDLFGLN